MVLLDTMSSIVMEVGAKLSDAGGIEEVDAISMQQQLFWLGVNCYMIRKVVVDFTIWMENDTLPWAAYQGLKINRFLVLESMYRFTLLVSGRYGVDSLKNTFCKETAPR